MSEQVRSSRGASPGLPDQVRRRQCGEQRADGDKEPLPQKLPILFEKLRPKGQLIGPASATGNNMRLRLSVIDEHLFYGGAAPAGGAGFLEILIRGPCSWWMFVSCIGFALPGLIHLWKCEHKADILAGVAMLVVAVTSTLCDSLFVDSAVYDEAPYERTSYALGVSPAHVAGAIKEAGAEPEVLANDGWNNITRAVDRFWASLVVFPCVINYMFVQRPAIMPNVPFVVGLVVAWATCGIGQHFRKKDPTGVRFVKEPRSETNELSERLLVQGAYVADRDYQTFMAFHELWHLLLIVSLCASAIYRPLL